MEIYSVGGSTMDIEKFFKLLDMYGAALYMNSPRDIYTRSTIKFDDCKNGIIKLYITFIFSNGGSIYLASSGKSVDEAVNNSIDDMKEKLKIHNDKIMNNVDLINKSTESFNNFLKDGNL